MICVSRLGKVPVRNLQIPLSLEENKNVKDALSVGAQGRSRTGTGFNSRGIFLPATVFTAKKWGQSRSVFQL